MTRSFTRSSGTESLLRSKLLRLLVAFALAFSCAGGLLPGKADVAEAAAIGTVTSYQKVSMAGSTVGYYTIDNKLAFCAEHSQPSPGKGAKYEMVSSNAGNDMVRKVLYYGYGGPGDLGYSRLVTTLALSKANGDSGGLHGYKLYDAVKNLEVPSSDFRVVRWVATSGDYQDLMTWVYNPTPETPAVQKGYFQIHKSSADPTVTDGNSDYSLEGARYYVYHDNGDGSGSLVCSLATRADGTTVVSQAVEYGNYKFVERVAPQGYSLDSTVYYFIVGANTIDSQKIVHLYTTDKPIVDTPAPEVETFELNIVKQDADTLGSVQGGASLAGAIFEVSYTLNNTPVTLSVETDASGKATLPVKLPAGTEVSVKEVEAPAGYVLSEATLTHTMVDGENTVNFPNEVIRGGLGVVKMDSVTGASPQGAASFAGIKFEIVSENDASVIVGGKSYSKGDVVATLNTDAAGNAETADDLLPYGTYTIREVATNAGYLNTSEAVTAMVDEDGLVYSFEMFDDVVRGDLKLKKVEAETGEAMAGVSFEVKSKATGESHVIVTDENGVATTEGVWFGNTVAGAVAPADDARGSLAYGTYTVTEIANDANEGYAIAEPFDVVIDRDSVVVDAGTVENDLINDISITKVDATTDEELPGASLVLKDAEGNVVEEWVSTAEAHVVKDVEPGTYTLTETIAPDGYLLSTETVTFEVKADASVTPVVMENEPYGDVSILKVDAETGEALAGATLVLTDALGNVVDEWVSTSAAHLIEGIAPGTYTLTEKAAPDGYMLFGGSMTIEVGEAGELVSATLKNEPYKKISVTKVDMTTGEELPGATLVLKDADGEVVEEWVSTAEAHVIKDIAPGTYTLTETIAPDGYMLSTETVEIVVTDEDKIVRAVMENEPCKDVLVSKVDMTTGEELPGATLVLTDEEGNVVEEWVSGEEPHMVEDVVPGTYILTETIAPKTHVLATESVTIVVNDDDTIVEAVMENEVIEIEGQIDKRQTIAAAHTASGDNSFSYTIDYRNTSNTWVDEFNMTDPLDCVSSDMARLVSIKTPVSFEDYDGTMNVWYQTNKNDKKDASDAAEHHAGMNDPANPDNSDRKRVTDFTGWKLWKADVSTLESVELKVSDLKLDAGEYVTAVRFEHGRVEEGFTTRLSVWDRKDLKSENDNLKKVTAPHADKFDLSSAVGPTADDKSPAYSPAVLNMEVTDKYVDTASFANSAEIDLYRNVDLHDEDSDKVVQSIMKGEYYDKTGDARVLGLSLACGCLSMLVAALFWVNRRRVTG